ncbi:helix-turn-helix domain-containing protein [Parabacteroides sp. GYB001]|uniref:helix-turn-helix domain-containing protein n=1 Tax=Parabacteroides leei TaxID=2939491 RepID=UPI002016C769|nr:helix-turn-helix transcriptional regulator [Parabacteroides leei]MCL3853527.1 helix-turn-helix domain-containing protein [Parabacteroides leei]
MHIGNKISIELEKSKISVSDFAKKINKSRGYMYAIFEKEDIDTGLLKIIAKALNIPIICFFDEEVTEQNNIGSISGDGNKVQQGHVNVMLESQEREIENLKMLLTEKDNVISEKERLIQILMKK